MKLHLLPFCLIIFILSGCGIKKNRIAETKDTCFYSLIVPPNLDLPESPSFDTTILRDGYCNIHILNLESWGTETEYILIPRDTSDKKSFRKCHFYHIDGPEKGTMDISSLDTGHYTMWLLACGNGGFFGLTLR